MLVDFSRKLLSALQLTRMALVFTAISNSVCAYLLLDAFAVRYENAEPMAAIDPTRLILLAGASVGLYGFGMSLNDIIDRRRDRLIAADRPLPSQRMSPLTAHAICALLAVGALVCGIAFALTGPERLVPLTLLLLVFTLGLIVFYDGIGKYLVAPGLISLGLIRFFHAAIAAPILPVIWHPLLLLNHVVLISALAYQLERKRPSLSVRHWQVVFLSLAMVDAMLIVLIWVRRSYRLGPDPVDALWMTPQLLAPALAALAFGLLIGVILWRDGPTRLAGKRVMLYGLLWLIVYDATFVWAYVGTAPALALLTLLPLAWLSVRVMRFWSAVQQISTKPDFQRVR